jgi:hypothetical protein
VALVAKVAPTPRFCGKIGYSEKNAKGVLFPSCGSGHLSVNTASPKRNSDGDETKRRFEGAKATTERKQNFGKSLEDQARMRWVTGGSFVFAWIAL